MKHVFIALCIQLATRMLTGSWFVGAAAGMWFFIGREYTQAEYRLIEGWYGGKRENMPLLAPLCERRAWNRKAMLDWIQPTAAVLLVWLVLR